jgi:hypothetical protein
MAWWLLAASVSFAVAAAAWVRPGVATDRLAYDEIIHPVVLGATMLITTAIAIVLVASGSQTKTVSCS